MSFRHPVARARRLALVDGIPTREERGLPHHPDGSGYAMCDECKGAGEHEHNDSHDGDPQCAYEVECLKCYGQGLVIDGDVDPMLKLAMYRREAKRTRLPAWNLAYGRLIAIAFSPPNYLP